MKERVKLEIDRLMELHGGKLQKERLIEAARPATSPLHGEFTWDKTEGWKKNLFAEAQALLREYTILVTVEEGREISTRGLVSLGRDRVTGGGYRYTTDVLRDKDLRASLLEDALREMEIFEAKYSRLSELAAVFSAFEKVRDARRKKPDPEPA